MKSQTYTLKDARANFSEIINRASVAGETIYITRFNEPVVKITPLEQEEKPDLKTRKAIIEKMSGVWSHRKDMDDPIRFVQKMRTELMERADVSD